MLGTSLHSIFDRPELFAGPEYITWDGYIGLHLPACCLSILSRRIARRLPMGVQRGRKAFAGRPAGQQ
jgi:hypothetical protein